MLPSGPLGRERRARILRVRAGAAAEADDVLAVEEPLEIRVNGEPVAVTMRTPGDDAELARGFLLTEGVARSPAEILAVEAVEDPSDRVPGNVVEARVVPEVAAARAWQRNFYASSSCGVCGKASIDMVRAIRPKVVSAFRAPRLLLPSLPARLREAQSVFETTGGLHAAGAFDAEGTLLAIREDVGRHNAVDKLLGWAAASGRWPLGAILLVSGRAGFELAQKASVAGAPVLAAVGAPSSLAVDLAEESGLTLVGFLRGDSMNVYTHGERLV